MGFFIDDNRGFYAIEDGDIISVKGSRKYIRFGSEGLFPTELVPYVYTNVIVDLSGYVK